nr:putative RNA polymerase II subunit B1 CTD phosphatase RPAP2 homolog [Tanacetum cinerariifolium]
SKFKGSKLKNEEKKIFDEMDFMSTIIMQDDGYSVSKQPSEPATKSHGTTSENSRKKMNRKKMNDKSALSADSSRNALNVPETKLDKINNEGTDTVTNLKPSGVDVNVMGSVKAPVCDHQPTDFLDSDDSWFDSPPEEFVLDLSPFGTMFMSLFAWVSSSTLAYVYGRDDSFHEDYASVNGREYPQKIVLTDGRSSEIRQTLAGCLSRTLPGLIRDLRLPTPVSTIELGLVRDTSQV